MYQWKAFLSVDPVFITIVCNSACIHIWANKPSCGNEILHCWQMTDFTAPVLLGLVLSKCLLEDSEKTLLWGSCCPWHRPFRKAWRCSFSQHSERTSQVKMVRNAHRKAVCWNWCMAGWHLEPPTRQLITPMCYVWRVNVSAIQWCKVWEDEGKTFIYHSL